MYRMVPLSTSRKKRNKKRISSQLNSSHNFSFSFQRAWYVLSCSQCYLATTLPFDLEPSLPTVSILFFSMIATSSEIWMIWHSVNKSYDLICWCAAIFNWIIFNIRIHVRSTYLRHGVRSTYLLASGNQLELSWIETFSLCSAYSTRQSTYVHYWGRRCGPLWYTP